MPPASELLKLDGRELAAAADEASLSFYGECPYTASELIAVAEKLISRIKSIKSVREKGEPRNPFARYFEEACAKANDQELDKLVELYTRLEPTISLERPVGLPALASRLVSREVASIRAEKRKVTLAKTEPAFPPELKDAPPELQEAWRAYQRAKAPFENAFPKVDEQIEVSANEKSFYQLIDAALKGSTGLEDEIRQYASTGANCLGNTDVEDAQDMAMLLMLLRERRLDEAIGAALLVAGTEGSISSPETIAGSIVELFETCGLDWEMIFAGGQAANEVRGRWLGSKNPYLAALEKYGSAQAGLLVNQLAHLSKPDARTAYIGAFGSWIETAPTRQKCKGRDVGVGRSHHETRAGQAMPRAIQEVSLHTTEKFSTADCSEDLALYALNIFGRTQAASSVPALQRLTRHVSSSVVEDATTVLCAMGLITAREPVRVPVRFRILLNGKPISLGQRITWNISSTKNFVSRETEANADGVIEVPRNHFGDPGRPAKEVELYVRDREANGMRFRVTVPAPGNLDETADVPVNLSSLEIILENQDRLNAPAPEKVLLSFTPHREEDDTSLGLPNAIDGSYEVSVGATGVDVYRYGDEVSAQPSIYLPAVQDGTYDVLIGAAGAEVWHGIARVGPGTSRIKAALKPGSHVRFKVVTPDGSPAFRADLFREGKKVEVWPDYYPYGYRALPRGQYEICIRGSEWIDEYRQSEKLKRGPDEVSYAGREVSFAITQGSPAIIDLGEIHLEAIGEEHN